MGRSLKEYIVIGLKGMAMGAADVVPGVSGGTIAFISGIYEELLESISNINFKLLKILKSDGIEAAWKQVNGSFLLSLFVGVSISIFSLAKTIKWLLENEPVLLWSFFFGLVLASIIYIGKQVEIWNTKIIILFILGISFGYLVTVVPPTNVGEINYLFLVFAGAIASCAMILPGISGAFIMVLLGAYKPILSALNDRDYKTVATVFLGAIVGLLVFSKILKWMFTNYKNYTLAILTGFIVGSLNKIWPWKETLTWRINSHDLEVPFKQQSISPFSFDGDPKLMFAIILAFVGFGLILLMEKLAVKKE